MVLLCELFEASPRVPKEQLDRIQSLHTKIRNDLPNIVSELKKIKSFDELANAFSKYRDYFQGINKSTGESFPIDVKFHKAPAHTSAGFTTLSGRPSLLINIIWFYQKNDAIALDEFREIIEHELIHAHDPKTQPLLKNKTSKYLDRQRALGIIGNTLRGDDDNDAKFLEKYFTSLHEFDAYSGSLLSRIRTFIDQQPPIKQNKIKLELVKKLRKGWKLDAESAAFESLLSGLYDILNVQPPLIPNTLLSRLEELNQFWKKTDSVEGRKRLRVRRNLYRTFLKRAYQELIA